MRMTTVTKAPFTPKVIRWAGLAALGAGVIFAGIQPIHPPDTVSSVTTTTWTVITSLKTAMCFLFLVGITAIYARQVGKAGWLGLAGFLLLSVSWWLQTSFVFAETFIMPRLAPVSPQFVNDYLGLARGDANASVLGVLTTLYSLVGLTYILGGLVFGIATLRARILSRYAAGLLVIAAALTPAVAFVPHWIGRYGAIPTAIALAWLGYSVWSEGRSMASEPEVAQIGPQLAETAGVL